MPKFSSTRSREGGVPKFVRVPPSRAAMAAPRPPHRRRCRHHNHRHRLRHRRRHLRHGHCLNRCHLPPPEAPYRRPLATTSHPRCSPAGAASTVITDTWAAASTAAIIASRPGAASQGQRRCGPIRLNASPARPLTIVRSILVCADSTCAMWIV